MSGASTILYNARILTLDSSDLTASALVIKDGKIAAVGEPRNIAAFDDPRAHRIDLGGRCVIPGLTDGHAHMDREGLKSHLVSLDGIRSIVDLQDLLAREAAGRAPGDWIVTMPLGKSPDYAGDPAARLLEGRLPNRDDLDAACPDNPVFIRPPWGYWRPANDATPLVSVVSGLALEASGIAAGTAAPLDGIEIERGRGGRPTGVIREPGPIPVAEVVLMHNAARFSDAQRLEALDASISAYLRAGTTAIFEGHGVSPELLRLYRDAREADRLRLRVRLVVGPSWGATPPGDMHEALLSWYGWARGRGLGDERLRIAGLYGIEGGEDRERLLAAHRPYTGWAGFTYESSMSPVLYREFVLEAARQGFRIATLFANSLDLFAEADKLAPIGALRWVVGHVGTLDADQIARMRDLGIVATLHTNRSIADIGALEADRLGAEREGQIVPTRALNEAGVPFALSSDNHPVSLFGPIAHCVTRRHDASGRIIGADQALSRKEALRAAAQGGAWLTFDEDRRGQIAVGRDADFAVLSNDPERCAESEIAGIRALATYVGGQPMHDESGLDPIDEDDGRVSLSLPSVRTEDKVFLDYDQEALNRAYDQRQWAGNAEEIIDWYAAESVKTRARDPVLRDIAYGDDPQELLDIYPAVPEGSRARAALIYVHGGAWRQLSKEQSGFFASAFTGSGIAVLAIDVGTRPAVPLPELIERVRRSILWFAKNADRYDLPAERLYLVGHSSGAHLAGAAMACDWTEYPGAPATPLAGALLASGPYDLNPVVLSSRGRYLDLDPEMVEVCSAMYGLHWIRHPVTLAVGDRESPEFVRQSRYYHAALNAAGIPARLIVAPGLNHFEISATLADPKGILFEEVTNLIERHSRGE